MNDENMINTERNVDALKRIGDIIKQITLGEYEEEDGMREIQLIILIDISQSLAAIADTLEKRYKSGVIRRIED